MYLRLTLLVVLCSAGLPGPGIGQSSQEGDFFEQRIRPLLAQNCHKCHTGEKKKGNLLLDSRPGLIKGGDSGPAIVPGQPDKSLLIKAVRYTDDVLRMPPRSKLTAEQIADLARWVERGAVWPDAVGQKAAGNPEKGFDLQERAKHWSFQPIRRPGIPGGVGSAGIGSPVDAFLQVERRALGTTAAPLADKRTLIRRVTFDLIGLPPTPADIDAFLRDTSASAFLKVVDRLLASPHYGERWGRHWLDLVRFAETCGHEHDFEIPDAYRYRDYVIRALNEDVPFDQFTTEHVAGDLLPNPRRHPVTGTNESILATGFWYLGEAKHSPVDVRGDEADRIDNQIDVFGKTFLGLTVACARCHDHKFDAISTKDYYALAGYLESSRRQQAYLDGPSDKSLRDLEAVRLHTQERARPQLARLTSTNSPPAIVGATSFEEFGQPAFDDWSVSGQAFGASPTRETTAVLAGTIEKPAYSVVPAGVAHSGLLSNKLQGVLRSRTFTIPSGTIAYRVAGKQAQINLIIDGFQLIGDPIYGTLTRKVEHGDKFTWLVQDVKMWVGHKAYIELIDDGPGYLAVDRIIFSDQAPNDPPEELASVTVPSIDRLELAELLSWRGQLETQLSSPVRALAMVDGTAWNERVHIRGNHRNLGEDVPRRFLEALRGKPPQTAGSGRLELARQLVSPSNPLLPRVIVNRIWQHHFGEGLVRSVDNFGVLGEAPTHPGLLDYLADEFVRTGWSLKKLHRILLLSQTYQMASVPLAASAAKDPQNRLLHHMPIRRLEAECIRDSLLAVSGRFVPTMYGPGIPTHLTPHMAGRGRPGTSGPLDGDGRRSIYLSIRRNFLSPLFLAFDFPIPFTTIGRRSVSNVPAQALAMLNNPFVVQQADHWARTVLATPGSARQRIGALYQIAFGRPPTEHELADAESFLSGQDAGGEFRAWAELCHVLVNVKEFIYVR